MLPARPSLAGSSRGQSHWAKIERAQKRAVCLHRTPHHPEKHPDLLSGLVTSKVAKRVLFVLVLAICAVGNLPWHLDNYDQAKQAYISYEIARGGSWWYQHTPQREDGYQAAARRLAESAIPMDYRLVGSRMETARIPLHSRLTPDPVPRGPSDTPRFRSTSRCLRVWAELCSLPESLRSFVPT